MQFCDEARHLFLEGVAVVFDFLGADVATRGQDMAVRCDLGGGGGFAEAWNVRVAGIADVLALVVEDFHNRIATPRMIG